MYSPPGIAVSPSSNSSQKTDNWSCITQQWRRQANVAELTPLLMDEGVYADNPCKLISYWTEAYQIYKQYREIIAI